MSVKTISNPAVPLRYNDRVQVLSTGESGTVSGTGGGFVEVRLENGEKVRVARREVALVLVEADWY